MAVAVTNIGTATGSTATIAVTVPAGGVPSGSLIFVCAVDKASSAGGSIADTAGNTYTLISSVSLNGSAANGTLRTYYCKNCVGLSSGNSITLTKVDAIFSAAMSAMYATGIDITAPLDTAVTASSTGNTSTPTVTSGTPSQSGELFIAVAGQGGTITFTQDSAHNWVAPPNRASVGGAADVAGGSQVNAGAGTIIFAPTTSAAANNALVINGFKAAAFLASKLIINQAVKRAAFW